MSAREPSPETAKSVRARKPSRNVKVSKPVVSEPEDGKDAEEGTHKFICQITKGPKIIYDEMKKVYLSVTVHHVGEVFLKSCLFYLWILLRTYNCICGANIPKTNYSMMI